MNNNNEKDQDQLIFEFIDEVNNEEWNPNSVDNSQEKQVDRSAESD